MGQKVRPTGFRTGIMVDWLSQWYASKQDFSELLVEDHKIRKFVKKRFGSSGISKIRIHRTREKVTVFIHSAKVGMIIGKKGQEVDKLTNWKTSPIATLKSRRWRSTGRRSIPSWWRRTSPNSWRSGPASGGR